MKLKWQWLRARQFSAGYLEKISIAGMGVGLFQMNEFGFFVGFLTLVAAVVLSFIEED